MPTVYSDGTKNNLSLVALLEAMLFLSSEPLSSEKLQELCNASEHEINTALETLRCNLASPERGLLLLNTKGGYQLGTKPELACCLEKLWEEEQISPVLSPASLETLAIIAVKQPVTRNEIEKIRGVSVDGVIENLLKRNLIKIGGRKEGLGRPNLYITTDFFLQHFGLNSLEELHNLLEDNNLDLSGPAKASED